MKLPGKSSNIYQTIHENRLLLTQGKVLSIDPSVGSHSSMPGYAVYKAGVLQESGTLKINPELPTWKKLQELHRLLRNLSKLHEIDACIYEQMPVSAHGGRSQVSHATLLMAVGVTIGAVQARAFIGILPMSWKQHASPGYVKSDEQDAIEIGRIVIEMAQQMISEDLE